MIFTAAKIPGAWIVDVDPRSDDRGFFARAWCLREFEAHGITLPPVQTNLSYNHRAGTIRGLHYQRDPHAEAKLVRCIAGAIYDVMVDLRPDSPTHGQWFGIELSVRNRRMLYTPQGCAHGYQSLTNGAEVLYSASEYYVPGFEGGLRWDDPTLAIEWPIRDGVIVSAKDASWPDFVPEAAPAPAR
jgi:dTDP-4-dehydrorhamnose 3,5-epimerase